MARNDLIMAKDTNITSWLKKIFSLQTLSVLIAVVGVCFTYKTYIESKPGQLTIEIPVLNESKDDVSYENASGISRYFSLGFYEIPPVSINNGAIGGVDNMLLFPIISNKTDKSLKDFTADIYIWYDSNMRSLFSDSKEDEMFLDLNNYNIISETDHNIHLSYKRDFLAPNQTLPYPIECFFLFLASESNNIRGGEVRFRYYVTYDGAKMPVRLDYCAKIYYDEREEGNFSDSFKSKEFRKLIESDIYANTPNRSNHEDGEWVLLYNNHLVRNLKHFSSDEIHNLEIKDFSDLQDK